LIAWYATDLGYFRRGADHGTVNGAETLSLAPLPGFAWLRCGDSPPATGDESLAMTEPKPSATPPVSEPASPSSEAAGAVAAGKPAGSLPSHIELIGLDQPAATRLLGPAAERSEEPPATVWRYKSGSCELDLFFYLDLRSGRMRTLHYALKDGAGDAAKRQNCLQSLIASRGN